MADPPTNKKERELLLQDCRVQLGRVWPVLSSFEKFAMSNTIPRLIKDVEDGERHLQSLKVDSGDIILDLEDQVERALKAKAKAKQSCSQCLHCHPDARYP